MRGDVTGKQGKTLVSIDAQQKLSTSFKLCGYWPQVLKRGMERFEAAWAEPGVQVVKLATVPEAVGLAPLLPGTCKRLIDGRRASFLPLISHTLALVPML